MFSTICLLFFLGFMFWMNTSTRISWPEKDAVMANMAANPLYSRLAAGALFLIATVLCVSLLGTGSGLFAAVVILMMAGSVSVLFFPFRYFGSVGVGILYLCAVMLELVIN
ncbi:putative phage infection (PIP) family protein YhgE [Dyadobacter sp. BE34]|uniref:Phage infection (PIP) family protein YhgE n=1 Tax=Dyadobacter fermentans TaxID=94254 RepID=A0ABU1QZE1_9BACT|nr:MULTISPECIES: hypothetical protein [Dyadobacter]MDR6806523.1 putative phage infection (PIP) family protein YhgE [Dyadobacter fermentans]MDR7044264.1 putative phage infection (PIP) family protein YhgE [Dyadobacter sp. BE242]MDR7198575.1 putative phage infection (PIP) family protein YhgE [Dyadobacter sp. BE34]MDR7216537.1 putative phage infection (PIP) family protein YhgE [Dyadobacter sp. BE31]MDR7263937.1 putative phage infection (PIP) family protein YhgE [Dyadobacter sp. BE32]